MSSEAKPQLFFLFHGRYPSEKAASLFLQKETASFRKLDYETCIIAPRRFGRTAGVPEGERVVYVPTIDLVPLRILQGFMFRISLLAFSWSALVHLFLSARRSDFIVSNEALPLLFASFWFPRTVFEMHDYPERHLALYRALFARVSRVLVTNTWKLEKYARDFPRAADKAFYEPNAVDVDMFSLDVAREEARRGLGIPLDAKVVAYTGHLYTWKGVDTLAEAAKKIPEVCFYVVGGTDEDVRQFKERWSGARNLHVIGRRPHVEIPQWQKAANVLVLPNTAKEEISAHYTSPMKLFEYMASGTPIVASDIPSIREIAGEGRAVLVPPDDAASLADGIRDALRGNDMTSKSAIEWVREHTWDKRAKRVISHLEK